MEPAKDRLYHYQQQPPKGLWDKIAHELDSQGVKETPVKPSRGKIRRMIMAVAVAAAVAIVLFNFVFNGKQKPEEILKASTTSLIKKDSAIKNKNELDSIIEAPKDEAPTKSGHTIQPKRNRYITVMGADGVAIRISTKVATLIKSADGENPPKPVWDKKVDDWQKIMLSQATPTSIGLMDIIEQESSIE